jgi:hypothetical protein
MPHHTSLRTPLKFQTEGGALHGSMLQDPGAPMIRLTLPPAECRFAQESFTALHMGVEISGTRRASPQRSSAEPAELRQDQTGNKHCGSGCDEQRMASHQRAPSRHDRRILRREPRDLLNRGNCHRKSFFRESYRMGASPRMQFWCHECWWRDEISAKRPRKLFGLPGIGSRANI